MSGTPSSTLVTHAGPADPRAPMLPSQLPTQPADTPVLEATDTVGTLGVGTVLSERYELLEPLGQGGAGSVWRAMHTVIGKHVAIKLLTKGLGSRVAAEYAERLLREARTLSRIQHPNVVAVVDHGFAPDGSPFIVMDLVEGHSLFDELHGVARYDRPWSWKRDVVLQLLDGLVASHEADIVHRDIKPENILISDRSGATSGPETWVTLVDYGIALSDEASSSNPRLTRAGSVFGTPMYMSPEQAAASEVDARTDIYSFGCVLHEMLAGQPPFTGSPSQVLARHLASAPPTLEHLVDAGAFPRGLLQIVARCLAKEPGDRFQSARELRDALANPQLAEAFGRKRRPAWVTLAFGAAVVGAVGLAATVLLRRDPVSTPLAEAVQTVPVDVPPATSIPTPVLGVAAPDNARPEPNPSVMPTASSAKHPLGAGASPVARPSRRARMGGSKRSRARRGLRPGSVPRGAQEPDAVAAPVPAEPPVESTPRIGELKNPYAPAQGAP